MHMENTTIPEEDNSILLPDTLVVPTRYCGLMYNMIDVCARRGAIQATELPAVGELVAFLKKELRVEEMIAHQKKNQTVMAPAAPEP
jgi:hypothetical protein